MTDAILKWANRNTRGHDHITPVNNYEESWADGLCFCALMYAYFPEKIPIKTLKTDTVEDKLKNLALAFKVASEAGIEPLLDPEDVLEYHEKKSMMLYLSEVYGVLKDLPLKFWASAEWNKKFDADENARKFAEWKMKQQKQEEGESTPAKTTRTPGSVSGKWQPNAEKEKEEEPSPSSLTSREKTPSNKVRWNPKANADEKEPEKATPSPTTTTKAAVASPSPAPSSKSEQGLTYEISGRGKEGGFEGRMLIFTVTLKLDGKPLSNPQKEDLVIHVECPGTPPKFNIMGGSGGAYHIGCTPGAGGQWWFDFVWRGIWCVEPWMLAVKNKFNKVPDNPYTGAQRKAAGADFNVGGDSSSTSIALPTSPSPASNETKILSPTSSDRLSRTASSLKDPQPDSSICSGRTCEMTDDDCGSFLITAKDATGEVLKGDYKFDIKISGPNNNSVTYKLTNNRDGTYSCNFGPTPKGDYNVEVTFKGKLLTNGSWPVHVVEVMADVMFEDLTILFHATDKYGTLKTTGGETDLFKVIATGDEEVEVVDLEDGRYTLDYHVQPGLNSIDVQYAGESLSGFPVVFEI